MLLLLLPQLAAAVLFGMDLAPIIAAIAAMFSALLTGITWYTAQRTRGAKKDVDAIRVTQDTLIETINFLRGENTTLREGVARCQTELAEMRLDRRKEQIELADLQQKLRYLEGR